MTFLDVLLYSSYILFLSASVLLVLLVLIQKGRGGGLSGAFGGGGGTNTAFGAKTGDVLTWATSVLFGVFLLLGIAMNLIANKYDAKHGTSSATTTAPAVPPMAPISTPPAPSMPAPAPTTPVPAPATPSPSAPAPAPPTSSAPPATAPAK